MWLLLMLKAMAPSLANALMKRLGFVEISRGFEGRIVPTADEGRDQPKSNAEMLKRWCARLVGWRVRRSAVQWDPLKVFECLLEGLLVGIAGSHSNPNPPDGQVNLGAD